MPLPFIIAIDGPSASGKGTLAQKLAAHYGFAHLDTGLLYRAVGAAMIKSGVDIGDAAMAERAAQQLAASLMGAGSSAAGPFAAIDFNQLMQDDFLRRDEVSVAASKVAVMSGVRAALLKCQKDFCATPPGGVAGAVVDGRDIGTVIAPQAQVKIFVTASAEARAERRMKELIGRGLPADYAGVLEDMKARDARDAERALAPTKPAADAVVLDTTHMTAADALTRATALVDVVRRNQ